ncbi:MAG: ParB N-terminal domain-containing protein [Gammaproteobacteria bacterium]|nr:ParB N-terminal domain-containing protein [Gammaproteobacteria bacterium]
MNERHTILDVDTITFDSDNPRIKKSLEKYGDKINAERIHFALRSAADGVSGTSSYTRLKDSIRASNGIISPITVVPKGNQYVCIDGNTRLAIYKHFTKEGVQGEWSQIKAIILGDANQQDIETVRVSAHLVGSREWPAYEKARYLHYLRNEKLMDYNEMIALCGGNKIDIERQIDAYHDMNEYYRDLVDDTAFQIDRFSGFVELQKPKVKNAIFEAGMELKDFGEWIRDGKIYRLNEVRNLPRVLQDDDARKKFLEGGPRSIEDACRLLDRKIEDRWEKGLDKMSLETATFHQLVEVLGRRINDLPYSELSALKEKNNDAANDQINAMENLSANLTRLIEIVTE